MVETAQPGADDQQRARWDATFPYFTNNHVSDIYLTTGLVLSYIIQYSSN